MLAENLMGDMDTGIRQYLSSDGIIIPTGKAIGDYRASLSQ
jgi:hypothetical protein